MVILTLIRLAFVREHFAEALHGELGCLISGEALAAAASTDRSDVHDVTSSLRTQHGEDRAAYVHGAPEVGVDLAGKLLGR
jgi:hypothetical protein